MLFLKVEWADRVDLDSDILCRISLGPIENRINLGLDHRGFGLGWV